MNKKLSIFAFTILFTLHASAASVIYKYQNLAENISHPWGIAVIDEKNILFTELTGALRIIEDGVLMLYSGRNILRILPPLVIKEEDVTKVLHALDVVLTKEEEKRNV